MQDIFRLTPIPGQARSQRQAAVSHGCYSLANLLRTVEAWEERQRFRWSLARMAKDHPHLIDDIGLTNRQVDAEITKRFWQP